MELPESVFLREMQTYPLHLACSLASHRMHEDPREHAKREEFMAPYTSWLPANHQMYFRDMLWRTTTNHVEPLRNNIKDKIKTKKSARKALLQNSGNRSENSPGNCTLSFQLLYDSSGFCWSFSKNKSLLEIVFLYDTNRAKKRRFHSEAARIFPTQRYFVAITFYWLMTNYEIKISRSIHSWYIKLLTRLVNI